MRLLGHLVEVLSAEVGGKQGNRLFECCSAVSGLLSGKWWFLDGVVLELNGLKLPCFGRVWFILFIFVFFLRASFWLFG